VIRIIDEDRTFMKLLVPARSMSDKHDEIRIREFRTANGLISFLASMGFTHANVPLQEGGVSTHSLPVEALAKDEDEQAFELFSPRLSIIDLFKTAVPLIVAPFDKDGAMPDRRVVRPPTLRPEMRIRQVNDACTAPKVVTLGAIRSDPNSR
jgi:hypothetical protein